MNDNKEQAIISIVYFTTVARLVSKELCEIISKIKKPPYDIENLHKFIINKILISKDYDYLVKGKVEKDYLNKELEKSINKAHQRQIIRQDFNRVRIGKFYNAIKYLMNKDESTVIKKILNNEIIKKINVSFKTDGIIIIKIDSLIENKNINEQSIIKRLWELIDLLESEDENILTEWHDDSKKQKSQILLAFAVLFFKKIFAESFFKNFYKNDKIIYKYMKNVFSKCSNKCIEFKDYIIRQEFYGSITDLTYDRHIIITKINNKEKIDNVILNYEKIYNNNIKMSIEQKYEKKKIKLPLYPVFIDNKGNFDCENLFDNLNVIIGNDTDFLFYEPLDQVMDKKIYSDFIIDTLIYSVISLKSLAKSFQIINKNIDSMMEDIPVISNKIMDGQIKLEEEKILKNKVEAISMFYMMLPSLRKGLLTDYNFRNNEFKRLYKKYIDKLNIEEMNNRITNSIDEMNEILKYLNDIKLEFNNNTAMFILSLIAIFLSIPGLISTIDSFSNKEYLLSGITNLINSFLNLKNYNYSGIEIIIKSIYILSLFGIIAAFIQYFIRKFIRRKKLKNPKMYKSK